MEGGGVDYHSVKRTHVTKLECAHIIGSIMMDNKQNYYLVKWNKPVMLNWGSGPTGPQSYAILDNSGLIFVMYVGDEQTPYTSRDFTEFMQTWSIPEYYFNAKYEKVLDVPCSICLDNESDTFITCTECHSDDNRTCRECSVHLKACPPCNNHPVVKLPLTKL